MIRYLLRCAWRSSHKTVTTGNVTRCVRCGREWTRYDDFKFMRRYFRLTYGRELGDIAYRYWLEEV